MIAWNELKQRLHQDGEFRVAARFWNATLRLDMGEASHRLRFEDGSLVDVSPCSADTACDVFVTASEAEWHELLAPVPRPYYQDLFGAQFQHGVRLPERPAYLHTFLLHPPPGVEIAPETHQDALRELIFNILDHRSENDPLNALLLTAGFHWREVHLMQLYRNYLMQVGTVYTKRTIGETLVRRPRATRAAARRPAGRPCASRSSCRRGRPCHASPWSSRPCRWCSRTPAACR